MKSSNLVEALRQVPEFRPDIIRLAWQVVGEDGSVDVDKCLQLGEVLDNALSKAGSYVAETREMIRWLRSTVRS
jgi:hypothetical protein